MKKIFLPLILLIAMTGATFAQSPDAVNYQAVARDGAGALLANENLDIRIGVYSGAGGAVQVYEETHSITTNQFGQFSLKMGEGTVVTGDFSTISWEGNEYHLKVEADDGTGYVHLGTNQLVTVPYAFHASTAETATAMNLGDLQNVTLGTMIAPGAVLSWSGTEWISTTSAPDTWLPGILPGDIFYNQGNVGIGTDAPNQALSVHTNAGISYIRVSDFTTGPSSGLRMGMSGSGNAYIINDEPTKTLSLGTNGITQVRIDDIGQVGINVTSPSQMLHVRQNVANRGIRTQHQSTADYWDSGVGTTTKNYKFYYNGIFRADISSVDGSYTQSSDRRLKRDIEYMSPVLSKVAQLKPATYHYIDNTEADPRSTGFVAQEVEAIFPNLVRDTDDGYKGLVYDGFAVISIKAIQELNDKVTALEAQLEELKQATENK